MAKQLSNQAQRRRDRAVNLAQHYFELLANRAGLKWESDNRAEVEAMVDDIVMAAVEEVKAQLLEVDPALADYRR